MMSSQGPGAAGSSLVREQQGAERSSHEQPRSSGVAMPVLVRWPAHHPWTLAHSPSLIMIDGSAQVPGA